MRFSFHQSQKAGKQAGTSEAQVQRPYLWARQHEAGCEGVIINEVVNEGEACA